MSTVQPAAPDVDQQDIDEARAFNAQLEALIAPQPPVYELPPEVTRKARRDGRGAFPAPVFLEEAQDIEIPARGGPIKLRVMPSDPKPGGIYLHTHGGGCTLGGPDVRDVVLTLVAH